MIKAKKVSFAYDQKNIFSDVSIELNQGEIICLIGPNGVGKSTFLDCILGFHTIKEGHIIIGQKDIKEYKVKKLARQISYVPQIRSQTFSYTVEDMVLMGRTSHLGVFEQPTEEDYKKVKWAINLVGLKGFEKRAFNSLSGGESQLVIIARALAQESPAIIMDEPTAHLDFHHELMILETIAKLVKENNISVIMATHFPNHSFYFERLGIPTRVGILHDGKLIAIGKPEEVINQENLKKAFHIDSEMVKINIDQTHQYHMVPLKTISEDLK